MIRPSNFSIVTTVFNGMPYLERFVNTAGRISSDCGSQIVIVDDGSVDGSADWIERCNHDAIKLLRADRIGRGRALNLGVKAADRSHIAILDVDDVMLPNRLEALSSVANKFPNATLLATAGTVVDEEILKKEEDYSKYVQVKSDSNERIFNYSDIFNKNFLIHSAVAYKKTDYLISSGYSEKLNSCIDLEFYFKLLSGGPGVYTSDPCVLFSFNRNSFYRRQDRSAYRKNLFKVLNGAANLALVNPLDLAIGYTRAAKYTIF